MSLNSKKSGLSRFWTPKYLEHQLGRFKELSRQVGIALDRLREYRSALITAAVIGQIDVRNVTSSSGKIPVEALS